MGISSPQGIGGLLAPTGISQFQQALAQYTAGEGILKSMQDFSSPTGGPSMSTMSNVGFAGDRAAGAKTAAEESQADQAAMANSINNQFGQLSSGLGSILAKGAGGGGGGGG